MKVYELLNEHAGWNLDKGLELDFARVLEAVVTGSDVPALSEKGETNKKHLVSAAKALAGDASSVTIHGKPSGAKPTYGGGAEPKSDLNATIDGRTYAISVKSGPAYAMSAGSKEEYLGIAGAAIALYQELYPAEAEKHQAALIEVLGPIANHIGTNRKVSDYSAKGLKDKKDSWFTRGPEKANLKPHERDELERLKADASDIIDRDNDSLKGQYKTMLREMEAAVKGGLKEAFSTREFAQCFIWEIVTGAKKFNGVHEMASFDNPKAAYANTMVYLDGHGVFDVSKPNKAYIVDSVDNHAVRLQNVPRGWCGTYFKNLRAGREPGAQLLADSLREIEFSLKIGVGPTAHKKVKESRLVEFAVDDTLTKTLERAISKTTLFGFCNAFGVLPILL